MWCLSKRMCGHTSDHPTIYIYWCYYHVEMNSGSYIWLSSNIEPHYEAWSCHIQTGRIHTRITMYCVGHDCGYNKKTERPYVMCRGSQHRCQHIECEYKRRSREQSSIRHQGTARKAILQTNLLKWWNILFNSLAMKLQALAAVGVLMALFIVYTEAMVVSCDGA